MPPDPPAKVNRRLDIGKYRVLLHIATGGMGAVYKALNTETGQTVALKVLQPELAARPNLLERFRREARSGEKLNHENVVRLYEWGEISGIHYIALEFVEGIDLHDYITRKGQLPVKESQQILIQAVKALGHLHEFGIIHRDVKPSNFLVSIQDGKPIVKLIDLGLARDIDEEEFRVTRAGSTVGTVDYMAPEQAKDSGKADIRSDIYALGCTWFHMLAGRAPFAEGGLTERLYKHVEEPPPDILQFNRKVPPGVLEIMKRMLAKKPEDRYQTPEELLKDLELGRSSAQPINADLLANLALSDGEITEPSPTSSKGRSRTLGRERAPSAEEIKRQARLTALQRQHLLSEEAAAKKRDNHPSGPIRRPGHLRAQDHPAPAPKSDAGPWWPWAAAVVGILVLAGVVIWLALRSASRTTSEHAPGADAGLAGPGQPPLPVLPQPAPVKPSDKMTEPNPSDTKPADPRRPRKIPHQEVLNLKTIQQSFDDSWQPPRQTVPSSRVFKVSRGRKLAGERFFESLGEACAEAPPDQETVIEIQDNGPLFEVPIAVKGKSLVIRGAKSYRPLLAWDAQNPASVGMHQFLSVVQGSLTLENLDVALQVPDPIQSNPTTLVRVLDGHLTARHCTVSVAGKHRQGVVAFQLESSKGTEVNCKGRLERCLVRGAAMVALDLRAPGADVLLDGCLLIGGERPLLDVRGSNAEPATNVRVKRSTLVAGHILLRVQPASPTDTMPALRWVGWDTLLARFGAPDSGEMVVVRDLASTEAMHWTPYNCLYAGWSTLLAGPGRDTKLTDLLRWHAAFRIRDGDDYVVDQPWPRWTLSDPASISPQQFQTAGTQAWFLDSTEQETLGCDLKSLPPSRDNWVSLTFEPLCRVPPLVVHDEPPAIPNPGDGKYHGQAINLDKLDKDLDLGKLLARKQQGTGLGRKVVLHLSGTGEKRIQQPIRVKGSSLTLYFEAPKEKAAPLELVAHLPAEAAAQALIDVEDGNLEILGGTLRLAEGKNSTWPAHVLRVRAGNLSLANCRLEGPLNQAPASFRSLILFEGAGDVALDKTPFCTVNQSILVSGNCCFRIVGPGAHLRLEGSALLSWGDGFHLDLGKAPSRINVQLQLTRNTVAAQRAVLHLSAGPVESIPVEPAVVQAKGNLLMDPFATVHKAGLLVCDGDAQSRGLLLWQGQGNAYDKRLHFFSDWGDGRLPEQPQSYLSWARRWGSTGEKDAARDLLLDKTLILPAAKGNLSLDCLIVPASLQISAGADLAALKINRKSAKKP